MIYFDQYDGKSQRGEEQVSISLEILDDLEIPEMLECQAFSELPKEIPLEFTSTLPCHTMAMTATTSISGMSLVNRIWCSLIITREKQVILVQVQFILDVVVVLTVGVVLGGAEVST